MSDALILRAVKIADKTMDKLEKQQEELERLTAENERLKAVYEAALKMATDYEAYEYNSDSKDWNIPIHNTDILASFEAAIAAVQKGSRDE